MSPTTPSLDHPNDPARTGPSRRHWIIAASIGSLLYGLGLGFGLAGSGVSSVITTLFDVVAHWFYEIPKLSAIRRDSQLDLLFGHLIILGALLAGYLWLGVWLGRHGRLWGALFLLGYVLRAGAWIVGGNLPLVPGDSSHYIEVATSILRGEGPVKHYVESFFVDYPEIREGRGILDDWATPLYSFVLAGAYRLLGVEPGADLQTTVAVAKSVSFTFNVLTLPLMYFMARRWFGARVGLWSLGVAAILPVHVVYAGMVLRESLVGFFGLLTLGLALEALTSSTLRRGLVFAALAGLCGGLMILGRNTGLAWMAAIGTFGLVVGRARAIAPLTVMTLLCLVTIAPWAWATYQEYGEPFYTYTKYFEYTPSWTVHHYQAFPNGPPTASQYYRPENAPEIVRIKVKALLIILVTSVMILGVPCVLGVMRSWTRPASQTPRIGRRATWLASWCFVVFALATLAKVADITQVGQLGRYYLPVFLGFVPASVAGILSWLDRRRLTTDSEFDGSTPSPEQSVSEPSTRNATGLWYPLLTVLLWSDPTWAYDVEWLTSKPYQQHWPALEEAGTWVRKHPEEVPPDARIMTWFPWEMRLASDRTTVLMPRSFQGQRIAEVIAQYRVTHVLWGSFEPPTDVDPETFGPYLSSVRSALGLTEDRLIHQTPREPGRPPMAYPVQLYRIQEPRR